MLNFSTSTLLSGALIVCLSACQKADAPAASSTTPTTPTTPTVSGPYQRCQLVGEVQKPSNSVLKPTMIYRYDAQGRLSYRRMTSNGNISWQEDTYTYNSDVVEIVTTNSDGNSSQYRGVLTASGYIQRDNAGTTYAYDADGYLIAQDRGINSLIGTYEINGGNVVKDAFKLHNDSGDRVVTVYQYDLTKPNWPLTYNGFYDNTVAFYGNPAALYGKLNRNLLVRQERSELDGHGVVTRKYITTYRYEYDAQGRVTRKIESDPDNPAMTLTTDYTYTCK
jgi:hypothetical protein